MSEPTSPPSADPTPAASPSLGSLGNPAPSAPPVTPIAQSTAQSFTDLLDDKGGFKQDWTKSLPDHLKPFEGSLSKYPTPFDALAGLGNAQALIGKRQSVKLPGEGATDEQWGQYRAEISKITGAPENAEGYGLKAPENLPPGVEWNGELAGKAAAIAHKYGLPPQALHELVALNNENIGATVAKSEAAQKAEGEALITKINSEWGKQAAENWQQTKRGIAILGGDPTKDSYSTEDVIRMGLAADRMFREDSGLINGDKGNTMATIDEKMAQLRADPAFQNPKNDKDFARQLEIQQQLIALHEAKKKQY